MAGYCWDICQGASAQNVLVYVLGGTAIANVLHQSYALHAAFRLSRIVICKAVPILTPSTARLKLSQCIIKLMYV